MTLFLLQMQVRKLICEGFTLMRKEFINDSRIVPFVVVVIVIVMFVIIVVVIVMFVVAVVVIFRVISALIIITS